MTAKSPRPLRVGPKRTTADAVKDAELRSGKASRVVSLSEFQNLTGYDRGTVSRWIERGCPIEGKGAKGATLVDIRTVMDWREDQARQEARRRSPDDEVDDGDEDRELKRKQIVAMNLKIAKDAGVAVNMHAILKANALLFNAFRSSMEGLPDRLERDWVGFPKEIVRKAKADSREHCRATLVEAQQSMERSFRALTKDRLADIGADPDDEFDADDPDDLETVPGEADVMEVLGAPDDV